MKHLIQPEFIFQWTCIVVTAKIRMRAEHKENRIAQAVQWEEAGKAERVSLNEKRGQWAPLTMPRV